jgi:uncharacterized protein (DUF2249 family)
MKITPQTKIADLIVQHPELVEVLVSYNTRFGLLKNPIMRKTFARLATVRHAAKTAGVNLGELIALLNNALGEAAPDTVMVDPPGGESTPCVPVRDLIEQHRIRTSTLDVRDIMRTGGEPFPVIMKAAAKVPPGEALILETLFEPAPLYDVLAKKGFEHQAQPLADDHFRVWFYRTAVTDTRHQDPDSRERIREQGDTVELDVRGLEPPGPMAMILGTLAKMDPAKTLVVHHERVPMFLYAKLEEKGYICETRELDPHRVELIIRHTTP